MGTAAAVRRRGRPARVEGQAATARVWVFVTPDERADLVRVARENGYGDIAPFVRDVVNAAVAEYRERPVFTKGGRRGPGQTESVARIDP